MTRTYLSLAGLLLAFGLTACGNTADKNQDALTSPLARNNVAAPAGACAMQADCPARAADVTRTIVDTPTGVAVDFVAGSAERVATLRTSVKTMADRTCGAGAGDGGKQCANAGTCAEKSAACPHRNGAAVGSGASGQGGAGCSPMPASSKAFAEIDGGARLTYAPLEGPATEAFRAAVRGHFAAKSDGACGMQRGACGMNGAMSKAACGMNRGEGAMKK